MPVKVDALLRNEVEINARIDWHTIRSMLIEAAIDELPNTEPHRTWKEAYRSRTNQEVKVTIDQETEGSPSYNVSRWTARVSIKFPVTEKEDDVRSTD